MLKEHTADSKQSEHIRQNTWKQKNIHPFIKQRLETNNGPNATTFEWNVEKGKKYERGKISHLWN